MKRNERKHSPGSPGTQPDSKARRRCRVLDRIIPNPLPLPKQHNLSQRLHWLP